MSFDWLLGDRRQWRISELPNLLGVGERTCERLFDEGQLYGHLHNAAGTGARMTKTIVRESIQSYLCRTATYDAEMRLEAAIQMAQTLTPEQRKRLLAKLER